MPEHDEIVIGCSLESLIYCFFTGKPFLYTNKLIPHEFDLLNRADDLAPFHVSYESKTLQSVSDSKQSRPTKDIIWHRLFFILNLKGFSLMPNECASIRIEDDTIKAFTANARMSKIRFKKLTIFDDTKLLGLPSPKQNNNIVFKVYDWINVRNSTTHPFDFLQTEDDLVNEIIFFPSRRSAIEIASRKDIIVISTINERDIDDYEFSDIAVRFKTLFLMKQAGIRGAKNGKDMLDKTKTKHYALKIESVKRDIIPITQLNIYTPTEQFQFNNKSYVQLLQDFAGIKSPFDGFMRDLYA